MTIINASNSNLLSFNVGDSLCQLLSMDWITKRCHMKEAPVRIQNKSQIIPAKDMVASLLNAQFLGDNLNQAAGSFAASLLAAGKSALYAFAANPEHDWNKLLMLAGKAAIKKIENLKPHKEHYLVFDDTVLEHAGAKKMELGSYIFDHNAHTSVKGYACLQCGWSDGISYFPLKATMIASNEKEGKKACKDAKNKKFDHRLHGAFTRRDARTEKPELVKATIKQVQKEGIDVSYVLMDSWFNYEPLLKFIVNQGLNAIGMLKIDKRYYHRLDRTGKSVGQMQLSYLFESFKHKRRKDQGIAGSEIVVACTGDEKLKDGIKLKIVYLHSYHDPKKILVLASTDLSLTPEQIVEKYSRRWGCETSFYNQKEFLGLGYETCSTDFDNQNAFANICCLRAVLIELHRRLTKDIRAMGEIARNAKETMRLMPLSEAISILLKMLSEALPEKLNKAGCIVEGKLDTVKRIIRQLINSWYRDMIDFVKDIIDLCPKTKQFHSKRKKKA